mmetsp:Transcript_17188/g.69143  ORF Transcript_17188/g.69143 Transcript_17188/m.69143 type:complete len:209 (-) Transcript_17188:1086-1712(-)
MGRRGRDGAAEMRWERGEVVGEIEAVVDVGIPREVGDEAQVDHHERRRIARRDGAPVLVQRDDAACAIALGLRDEPERRARAGSIGGRRRGRCRGGDVGCEGREPEGGAVEHPRDAPQVFVAVRIPRPAPALLGRAAREPLEAVELPRDALLVDDEEARIEALDLHIAHGADHQANDLRSLSEPATTTSRRLRLGDSASATPHLKSGF